MELINVTTKTLVEHHVANDEERNRRVSLKLQRDADLLAEWSGVTENKSSELEASVDIRTRFLFDDIAINFDVSVFLHQLFVHMVPGGGFLIKNSSAQQFLNLNKFAVIYNWLSVFALYLMIISYFNCPSEDQDVVYLGYLVPIVLLTQHKITIAVKYACLSPTELDRFFSEKNDSVTFLYQVQMQLLTGWYYQREDVINFELGAAAVRLGAKINQMYFMVPDPTLSKVTMNQFKSWNTLLSWDSSSSYGENTTATSSPLNDDNHFDCETNPNSSNSRLECAPQLRRQEDGSYLISVYDFTLAIIKLAGSSRFSLLSNNTLMYIVQTISMLIISVPYFQMAYAGRALSSYSPWFFVFLLFSGAIVGTYGPIFFSIFFVVIFDVKRQQTINKILRNIIRLTDLDPECRDMLLTENMNCKALAKENVRAVLSMCEGLEQKIVIVEAGTKDDGTSSDARYDHLPRLCFSSSQNILSWMHARCIVQNFGLRFRKRIDIYTFCSVVLQVFLLAFQFLMLILADDRTQVALQCGFIQVLFSVTLSLLFLMALLNAASNVNETYIQHKNALSEHGLRLRNLVMEKQLKDMSILTSSQLFSEETRLSCALNGRDDDSNVKETNEDLILQEKEVSQLLSMELNHLQSAVETVESCVLKVESNNREGACKVLGFIADDALTQYVASSMVSFYVVMLSLSIPAVSNIFTTAYAA